MYVRFSLGLRTSTAARPVATGEVFVTLRLRPPGPVTCSCGAAPAPRIATAVTCERLLSVNVFAAAAMSAASFPPRVSPPDGALVVAPALIAARNGPLSQPPTWYPPS